MTARQRPAPRRVFLSFARDDLDLAQRIRAALEEAGISVENQTLGFSAVSLLGGLHETVRTGDAVVLLLTPTVLAGPEANAEIQSVSRDMDRLGVDLLPVVAVALASLPSALKGRGPIDLTKDSNGVRRLAEQISATWRIEFSSLNPLAFEDMVADLLTAVGFRTVERSARGDAGVDIRATYERVDPFGTPETEVWLVETKLYSHVRVSPSTIRALAGTLATAHEASRGLLVTSGSLTSMALEVLTTLSQRSGLRLQVLDGTDLRRLLRQFPAVTERHFPPGPADSTQASDGDS